MGQFSSGIEYETIACCTCNMNFAITAAFMKLKRSDKTNFFCPAGHKQAFTKTLMDEMQEALDATERKLERVIQEKVKLNTKHEKYVREAKRIVSDAKATKIITLGSGRNISSAPNKCSVCHTQHYDMRSHMRNQHPQSVHMMLRSLRESYNITQIDLAKQLGLSPPYISMFESDKPALPDYAANIIEKWIING